MENLNYSNRILYVDDDLDLSEMLKEFIEEGMEGISVELAADGLYGLELLRKHKYDIIISDFRMPRMNGIQFLEQILVEFGNSKPMIIFSSGFAKHVNGNDLDHQKFENVIFMDKPFSPEEMIRKIQIILESKKRFDDRFNLKKAG